MQVKFCYLPLECCVSYQKERFPVGGWSWISSLQSLSPFELQVVKLSVSIEFSSWLLVSEGSRSSYLAHCSSSQWQRLPTLSVEMWSAGEICGQDCQGVWPWSADNEFFGGMMLIISLRNCLISVYREWWGAPLTFAFRIGSDSKGTTVLFNTKVQISSTKD